VAVWFVRSARGQKTIGKRLAFGSSQGYVRRREAAFLSVENRNGARWGPRGPRGMCARKSDRVHGRQRNARNSRRSTGFTLAVALAILSAGCSWPSSNGHGRTHLVFGLGFITTADDIDRRTVGDGLLAKAQRLESTGAFFSTIPGMSGLHVGHSRRQSVEIAPEAQLILEAVAGSSGVLQVTALQPQGSGSRPQHTTIPTPTDGDSKR
jgi:hypothetical protein